MQEAVFDLLEHAGIHITASGRNDRDYRPRLSLPGFEAKLLKPQNIVEMLHVGSRDLGFAGADWVAEKGANLIELLDTELDPVSLVAAIPSKMLNDGALPTTHLVVASEYERLTRGWIASRKLDATRLYYGSEEEKAAMRVKTQATEKLHEKASVATQARRGAFNASASGEANLLGNKELVDDISSGRVDLQALPQAALPEPLRALAPGEQAAKVEQLDKARREVRQRMVELSKKRDAYLKDKVEKQGGARDSLDRGLFDAVRKQAGKAGLSYEADALRY